MARRPEIGNIQLYPNRPLQDDDKNGYVLKFYCPIQQKRVRRNCGTRIRREARKILRECRERLLNGRYVESGGAITIDQERETVRSRVTSVMNAPANSMTWQECFDQYYRYKKSRCREKSLTDASSRIEITGRILDAQREDHGLAPDGPIGEYVTLDALEYAQERLLAGDEGLYDQRAPMTVNTTLGAVMTFLRHCQRHGWIDRVPPLSKLPVDEVMKGRPISFDEFGRMIEATPSVVGTNAADSWRAVLQILWESAFRVGDVMNFSWDDERRIHPSWPTQDSHFPTLLIPSSQKNKKAQEIPMLPGLQELLEKVPVKHRNGWVVNPRPIDYQLRLQRNWFKPTKEDLAGLTSEYGNTAIARACGVSEACVRKWLNSPNIKDDESARGNKRQIPQRAIDKLRVRSVEASKSQSIDTTRRLTKEHVGRVISQIGDKAGVVVQRANKENGRRIKYASAHDVRRGCAQRLINAGISAETLKVVLRHKDFKTTELFYGAVRAAQSAASELHGKLTANDKKVELVGGLVGGTAESTRLSAEELMKLKRLLNSL